MCRLRHGEVVLNDVPISAAATPSRPSVKAMFDTSGVVFSRALKKSCSHLRPEIYASLRGIRGGPFVGSARTSTLRPETHSG